MLFEVEEVTSLIDTLVDIYQHESSPFNLWLYLYNFPTDMFSINSTF